MAIGIDVGGSKILVVKEENNEILEKEIVPTKDGNVLKTIKNIIDRYDEEKVGIGIPGYLVRGKCITAPNISELKNVNLKKYFPNAKIMNDGTAMAYGEYILRKEKYKTLLLIALGTGVGAGLVVNRKPYVGRGSALEIGHLKGFSNKKCNCGKIGCFETVAGGFYLPDMKEMADRARKGEEEAIRFYENYGKIVAKGIAHAIQLLDPEIVVIGGGIGEAFELFENSMKKELSNLLSFVNPDEIIFEKSLSYDSGGLGAAIIAERDLI